MDLKLFDKMNFYPLVPLQEHSKKPAIRWSDEKLRIKNTSDLNQASTTKNYTGYAIVCGKPSNIIVIDLDVNHGSSNEDGIKNFNNFIKDLSEEDKNTINSTFYCNTANGGKHLYFRYKEGLKSKAGYLPSVDIKTDGGLIVAPGTIIKNENQELKEYTPHNSTINDMPQSLFNKLLELSNPVKEKNRNKSNSPKTTKVVASVFNEGKRNQELFRECINIVSNSSIRDINIIRDIVNGLNILKCKPPLKNEEVENITQSILSRLYPGYCDQKGNVNQWELVEYVLEQEPCYSKGNLWFKYDKDNHFYDFFDTRKVRKMYFEYAIKNTDKTPVKSNNFSELLLLASENACDNQDEKRYINCLNGVIDIYKNELLEHDPKYKLNTLFDAKYDIGWKDKFDKSKFRSFLLSTFHFDDIPLLQECFGLVLSPHAKEVQKCFVFKGEGSNGKSATFNILESIIHDKDDHICSIGLGDFGQDFVISSAEGKHANIVRDDDLSMGQSPNKLFKSMVCSEPVQVNRKHKDIVRLSFNMTHIFGLNNLPNTMDKSNGFYRRMVIIPFDKTFGTKEEVEEGKADEEKDPSLEEYILNHEKDIVFMWAFEGLQRLIKNKWNLSESDNAKRELEEYKEDTNSAYSFYKRKVKVRIGNRIPKNLVYNAYKNYCEFEGITPMHVNYFGRYFKACKVGDCKMDSKVRCWKDIEVEGINVKEDNTNLQEIKNESNKPIQEQTKMKPLPTWNTARA